MVRGCSGTKLPCTKPGCTVPGRADLFSLLEGPAAHPAIRKAATDGRTGGGPATISVGRAGGLYRPTVLLAGGIAPVSTDPTIAVPALLGITRKGRGDSGDTTREIGLSASLLVLYVTSSTTQG